MSLKKTTDSYSVAFISLGCDKNRVDCERLIAEAEKEFKIVAEAENADILVINTCSFLESAREESINTVFKYLPLKKEGRLKKIVMTGCLPQKYIDELFEELEEVDAFLGAFDGTLFLDTLRGAVKGERLSCVGCGEELTAGRVVSTPASYTYLKASEGCSNYCTYCLIPKIRGRFRSYPLSDLVKEAESLGETQELVLVAQDLTRYGEDIYGKCSLPLLIDKLSELDNIKSIRLLYCYPELIDNELIDRLCNNPKLIKYIDVPFQHASNSVLKRMNRRGTYESYLKLVERLKGQVKSIAIRSTFITGFPGESENDFEILKDFLKKAELFNAGFFAYSKEPDTAAYRLSGQVKEEVKLSRQKELYTLQKSISKNNLSRFKGKTIKVLCDGIDDEFKSFYGRAYFSAPDIDGVVFLSSEDIIEQGKYYLVKITDSTDYDLYGEILNELT